jgi:hypothetical protein
MISHVGPALATMFAGPLALSVTFQPRTVLAFSLHHRSFRQVTFRCTLRARTLFIL